MSQRSHLCHSNASAPHVEAGPQGVSCVMWHRDTDRGSSFGLRGGVSANPAYSGAIRRNWIGIWGIWRLCQCFGLFATGIGTPPWGLTWSAAVFRWLMNVKTTSANAECCGTISRKSLFKSEKWIKATWHHGFGLKTHEVERGSLWAVFQCVCRKKTSAWIYIVCLLVDHIPYWFIACRFLFLHY